MIGLIKPYISYDEVESQMREVFDTGILTKGKHSKELPEKIKAYTGAKYAYLATSATTALTMALKVVGVGPGDEVIVSDFSFPASVNVIEDLGATPVFADVSLETFNMLPEELEKKITSRTKAVMFVDALGNPSGVDRIHAICEKNNIPLIEDAACAIGSSVDGVRIGNVADISCFSLHPRKLLTSGEGGVLTTNNDDYAHILNYKLNHGQDASGEFVSYGYNYRLSEISSLVASVQVDKIDQIIKERNEQADLYSGLLGPLGFKIQEVAPNAFSNRQSIVFVTPKHIDRDALSKFLLSKGIESTIGTYCLSNCKYYREKYDDVQPNAFLLQNTTITLPCYHGVPVEEVCDAIQEYTKAP